MKHVTFHLVKNYWRPAESVERHLLVHRPGATLSVYLDELKLSVEEVQLFVSGRGIQAGPDMVYPLPGEHWTIAPHLQGGGGGSGGGGKDVGRSVAMLAIAIALTVAAVYSYGGTAKEAGFAWSSFFSSMAAAAWVSVGGMVVNAIFPPQTADIPQLDFTGDWGSSNTYGWDIRNQDQPGFAIPVVYGTHRVGGQVIARHVTTDGDKQYLNILLAVSEGPIESITDLQINNQPVTNYKDVNTETKLGALDQTPVANFRNLYQDRPVDAIVSYGTPVTRQTQGTAVEGLEITLAFPRGLYATSPGDLNPKTVSVKLEYREVGAGSWTAWDTVSITDNRSVALRRVFRKEGLTPGHYEVQVTRQTADDEGTSQQSTMYWSLLTEITTDDLAYPGVALYSVKLLATDQLSGGMPTITSLVARGDITVYEEDETPHTVASDNPAWAAWDILNNSRYGAGISHTMLDYTAFKSWADWCDEMVPDGLGGTEKRCTLNIVLDSQMTVFEAASKACTAGRAALVTVGSKYSVVADRAVAPTNLYAVGNILADSLEITYLPMNERSREIEVQFANPLKEYRRDTLSVVDQEAEYDNKSTLSLIGVTRKSQAVRLAKYMLYLNKY
ncbi:MAG: hypothetical protein KKC37_14350, partial [Proteobacteria bacterium]|nr:hypothetical protein [Pseudomonadota bacterium]